MMEGALSRPLAERLVEAATAAPSMHNSQPWRFVARLADRVIEIYADPARAMRRGDPRGRAVHIACGAALFNLRLAVAHAGAEPVTRLLPNHRDPLLLASVRAAGPHRPHPDERALHFTAERLRDRRQSFTGYRSPPRAVLAALAEAASLEGASLRIFDPAEATRMLQSVLAIGRGLASDPGFLAGLQDFTHDGPRRAASPDSGPRLAVLTTRADDRVSWLRAGQALQRVLLLAAYRGVEASPVTPMLEAPDAPSSPYARHGAEYLEMILQLGAARAVTGNRRPVSQVMRVISPVRTGQDEGPHRVTPPALPGLPRELIPLT